jgi:hypothetical protein
MQVDQYLIGKAWIQFQEIGCKYREKYFRTEKNPSRLSIFLYLVL